MLGRAKKIVVSVIYFVERGTDVATTATDAENFSSKKKRNKVSRK